MLTGHEVELMTVSLNGMNGAWEC